MKRLALYILLLLSGILCNAQSAGEYKGLEELQKKMQALEKNPGNMYAYLSLMPEMVEMCEFYHIVNADYVQYLIYLGHFYYIQLDLQSAAQAFDKATYVMQENPAIKSQVSKDLLGALQDAKRDLANMDKAESDNDIETQFKAGHYMNVIRLAHSYLQKRKEYVMNTYFSLSEQERNKMSHYVEKDIYLHYIISSVYYTNDFSIMGELYDYILFLKQLQLRTSKQISDAIKRSGDMQLLSYYDEYNALRKLLALSNPPMSFNRDSVQARINSLERMLALHGNLLKEEDNVSWTDIQKRLIRGSAAIEFVEFNLFKGANIKMPQVYAAMIITQTCTQPILKLTTTKKNLTYWHPDNPGNLYAFRQYGGPLAQLFWKDLAFFFADEGNINTIYFSPDGVLHTLAIESLPYDKESPMSWHYNLTRLSSTRELAVRHNHYIQKTATLYGDLAYRLSSEAMAQNSKTRSAIVPIPGTKTELDSIARVLEASQYKIQMLTRQNGTEETVKALDGHSPSLLHFATHGFVRNDDGDIMRNTGLVLSYGARAWEGRNIPQGVEDGILTAAEIETLDLSGTDVVVLSACNTALGEVTPEGVWGLQRAFKKAGVGTVIMSLWQVDDEATAVFMGYFYEALMTERRVHNKIVNAHKADPEIVFDYTHYALHTAKDRMRTNPQYADPYFWAAFIAIM